MLVLKGTSATLKCQNQFLMDFVQTVYTVFNSKTIPVLPKKGVALAREQSQSTIRQSDTNFWAEFVLTIWSANIARTIFFLTASLTASTVFRDALASKMIKRQKKCPHRNDYN